METNKLDFEKISISQEGNLMLNLLSFMKFHELYQEKKSKGKGVSDMRLTYNSEEKVTEAGFRQFLLTISSLDFDARNLSKEERGTINDIRMYLMTPREGDPEPIRGDRTTLNNLINIQINKKK